MKKIEEILEDVIKYKFETKAELREIGENLTEKIIMGFGYLVGPIVDPIDKLIRRVYDWHKNL